MTTIVYTVDTEAQLAAAISAVDQASCADAGNGTTYQINIASGATLTETAALPSINLAGSDSLTIQGNGATLNGNGAYSGLVVLDGGSVTVDNMTIENAVATGSAAYPDGVGGGLYMGSGTSVTLDNVSFVNDSAINVSADPASGLAVGGAIYDNGTLTIESGNIEVGTINGVFAGVGNTIYIDVGATQSINLTPTAGETLAIYGVIADQTIYQCSPSLAGSLIINGAGTVLLAPEVSATNTAATANLFSGGIALQSGTLELASAHAAGSGVISFGSPATGNPAPVLKLDQAAFTNGSFANAVTGFALGDTIDLAGLSTQSIAYNSQTGTLTVGGDTVNLSLQSGLNNVKFVTSSDGHGGTDVTLAGVAVAPTITGIVAGQTTSNGAALDPFAKVTIADANAGASETLFITLAGSGTLKDGAGFSGLGTSGAAAGIYVLQGSAASVTKELDALVFTPAAGAPNASAETTFTLQDISTAGTLATNSVTTVTNTNAAVASVISGTVAGQVVGVGKTISPFAHAVISDANANSTDTVYIDVSSGSLRDGAGFSGLTASSLAGLYSIKAQSAAQATAEVEALVYTPAPTASPAGVGVQFVVQNSAGIVTSNSTTTLTVDSGPKTGAVSETLVEGTGIDLTSAVLAAATPGLKGDTLSITAVNGAGTLGNFSLVNGELIYAASTPKLTQLGANCTTTDSLGYTVSDQYGDTATGSVALTITNPQATTTTTASSSSSSSCGGLLGSLLGLASSLLGSVSAVATSVVDNLTSSFATLSGGDACTTVQDVLGNALVTLGNGNDTILAAGLGNKVTLGCGTDLISQGLGLETIVLGAGTDTVNLGGTCNNVTLNSSHATVCGGQGSDTVTVNGGSDNLTFAGSSSLAAISGIAAVNICDLGSALTLKIGSSTQNDCITGFGTTDCTGVVDLLNGCGGYASTAQIINNLHSDGHGGSMLSLGSNCSIDFAGASLSQLHASNFKIG